MSRYPGRPRERAGRTGPRPRWAAGVVVLAVLSVVVGTACGSSSNGDSSDGSSSRPLSGVVRTPVPNVSTFSLPEASDAATPFPFVAKKGQLLLVYFGYTACPDVCPTTLSDVRAAFKKLGAKSERVSVAMATIDPRRDTPTVISAYLRSFFPDGIALRTDDDVALRAVTDAFGASYDVKYPNNTAPQVAHSAFLYVIDDEGRMVLQWPFGTTSGDIADDLEQLLD